MPHTLAEINGMDRAHFVSALGHLFEHSPWVADLTYERRPFLTAQSLHAELCATLARASLASQLELIRAHPDLAGRLAMAGKLTAASTAEQASAGLDRLASEELALFQAKNEDYKARFGFPFVICARLNDKATILRALNERIANSPDEERQTALKEIEKIAWLRLSDLVRP